MNAKPEEQASPRTGYGRLVTVGLFTFVLLFGGIFGWAAFAEISGAVIGGGSVMARGKPKLVQHLDGGIVKEIFVKNGDVVRKGDILVSLDDTLLVANLEIYRHRLREAVVRKVRLDAERDGAQGVDYSVIPPEILEQVGDVANQRLEQDRLFVARRASRQGQVEQLREKIRQFGNQIVGVKGVMEARERQLSFVNKELVGIKTLHAKGLSPETRVLAQEARRAELEGQLSENGAELARIDNSIRETEIAILQIDREFLEAVLNELRETDLQVDELSQQLFATNKQLERIEIRASVNGVVHELSTYTIGGVVPPGGVLMQLVPTDEGLEVEVRVEPHSIDQVHLGQTTRIRFPGFNQRTTPEIVGKVMTKSAATIVDEKTGVSFYNVEVSLSPDEIERLGANLQLIPGMPSEVFFEVPPRTVMSFLFKPLNDSLQHAFREE